MAETLSRTACIAVVGNPNTGKTTLFNQLTGLWQHVGNFPGCTVSRKVGQMKLGDTQAQAIDMPGTYSLSASSPDEMVAVDTIFKPGETRVDAILVVADASALSRNLYLVSQLLEAGLPMVMALNMTDVAEQRGIRVDAARLQAELGFPVIPTCGRRGLGMDELRTALRGALDSGQAPPRRDLFPEWQSASAALAASLNGSTYTASPVEVFRALVDEDGYAERRLRDLYPDTFPKSLADLRGKFAGDRQLIEVETAARHKWARDIFDKAVTLPAESKTTFSDRLDAVLTHKVWGTLVLIAVLTFVFQAIFAWAGPMMDMVDAGVGVVSDFAAGLLPEEGMLTSLVLTGIIGGVGGVIIFLPQILMLFLFISILEDSGYMARAAFLLDKLFAKCGLSGRSLIPMLSSFACAVPGVMSARTIENRRDRLTTILVAPLMSCSARLPVYVIMISAFVPERTLFGVIGLQGLTLFLMYCVGIVVAVPVAWILKRTMLRGDTPPFLLELPSYKMPNRKTVFRRVWFSGKEFIVRAGTIILAMAIVVWALMYFPRSQSIADFYQTRRSMAEKMLSGDELTAQLDELAIEEQGEYTRNSYFGRMGRVIEPAVKPLGWDWKIGMSVIASFPAREVIIATLGTVYNLGDEVDIEADEDKTRLQNAFQAATWPDGRKVFSLAVALSIMVFFALCSQCMATLAVIKQETGAWKWAVVTFVYMTVLAYAGAFVTYQAAVAAGWGGA